MTFDPHELRRYPKLTPYRRLPYMEDEAVLRLVTWYRHCSETHAAEPRSNYHRLHLAAYMEALKRGLIKDTKGAKPAEVQPPKTAKEWQF